MIPPWTRRTPDARGLADTNIFGAWAADVEMDGDLDIVLGVTDDAARVLRNNRDEEHQRLHAKVGELLMENELLYAKVDHLEAGGPLARRRSTR